MSTDNNALAVPPTPTDSLDDLFDTVSQFSSAGIVLLTGTAIIASNRAAYRFLAASDVACFTRDSLVFRHEPTQRSFCSQVASGGDWGPGVRKASWFAICDASGQRCASAAVYRVEKSLAFSKHHGAAYVLIARQMPALMECSPLSLVALYGLTSKEAIIATHVLRHSSVAAIASALTLSRHTVRTHLKSIFVKCSVHSITELGILVATGAH